MKFIALAALFALPAFGSTDVDSGYGKHSYGFPDKFLKTNDAKVYYQENKADSHQQEEANYMKSNKNSNHDVKYYADS